jgi:hypothetical protein
MDTCYKKTDLVIYGLVGDESVLVPVRDNVGDIEGVFNLNTVGSRIWELIDGKKKVETIYHKILGEYEVEEKVLEKDLLDFLKQLAKRGWIETVEKRDNSKLVSKRR